MTKLEAWYRRNFCECMEASQLFWELKIQPQEALKIGTVWYEFTTQKISYIYVGKKGLRGMVWIKKH